jgi:hypothetical protein
LSITVTFGPSGPPDAAMRLLAGGVPLSLLLDLAFGPDSEDLLRNEPEDSGPEAA